MLKSITFAIIIATTSSFCATATKVATTTKSVLQNPAVQQAAIDATNVAAIVEPQYASLAPVAVQEVIALTNGTNPVGVTGSNLESDTTNLVEAVSAMIPTNKGAIVADKVATIYTKAMTAPGMTATPGTANAVIGAIAQGLASKQPTALSMVKESDYAY